MDSFLTVRNICPTLTTYPIAPYCPWHEAPASVETIPQFNSETKLEDTWQEATRRLGGVDAPDFTREIVERLECPACGKQEEIYQPAEKIREDQLRCHTCGAESAVVFLHSIGAQSKCLQKSAREIGLPAWDIIWARRGEQTIGFELSGDDPFAGVGSNIRK